MKKKSSIDVSSELEIYRYANGFKLVRPMEKKSNETCSFEGNPTGYSLASAEQWPINFTILNRECKIQTTSELCAMKYNYGSIVAARGKSIADVANTKSACHVLNHNREVMDLKRMRLFAEEVLFQNDGVSDNFLTIKSPLYNNRGEVIGLLGCGFIPSSPHYKNALKYFKQCELLNSPQLIYLMNFYLSENNINQYGLSKREAEVMQYTIQGKTAKIIAKKIDISPRTVEQYLENIKFKMKVASKRELLEKALNGDFNIPIWPHSLF